jgi:tetratricopeptide (TPR) repeat protein
MAKPSPLKAAGFPVEADDAASGPLSPRPQATTAGDAASTESTLRLKAAVGSLKLAALKPLLDRAVEAIKADDWKLGGDQAIAALNIDEKSGLGWWVLAICREKAGDLKNAFACYEAAVGLLPANSAITNDLGRLAYQLGQKDVAEKLFGLFLGHHPNHPEGANNLACALRDQQHFDAAIDVLKPALNAHPKNALMWNTLGTVLNERGDVEESMTFYGEALRLDPRFARARYNRGNARLTMGDLDGALEDVDAALASAPVADAPMMRLARALALIARGDLARGWEDYEVRFDPQFREGTRFLIDRPRWTPDMDLNGKSFLVIGEQGLGDEIMFANVLPDLVRALGPKGRLTLAVETRQVKLFQQSFPDAHVGAHATIKIDGRITVRGVPFVTDPQTVDAWTPIGSLLRRFRPSPQAFPDTPAFLKADPERVAFWRAELAALGPGPMVGVLWKSLKVDAARRRFFSPFDRWRGVLATPGVRFVNLQYGDCREELAQAAAQGLSIWNPPGIDLKNNLDEVAALACALDLTVGPPNATTNIAAACGAKVWMLTTPGSWTQMGTGRYPWYPTVRPIVTPALNQWEPVMAQIADALRTAF